MTLATSSVNLRQSRVELAGGLAPTACLQGGSGEGGERARPRHAACTVGVAGSDRPGPLGSGWGQIMRMITYKVRVEGRCRPLPADHMVRNAAYVECLAQGRAKRLNITTGDGVAFLEYHFTCDNVVDDSACRDDRTSPGNFDMQEKASSNNLLWESATLKKVDVELVVPISLRQRFAVRTQGELVVEVKEYLDAYTVVIQELFNVDRGNAV